MLPLPHIRFTSPQSINATTMIVLNIRTTPINPSVDPVSMVPAPAVDPVPVPAPAAVPNMPEVQGIREDSPKINIKVIDFEGYKVTMKAHIDQKLSKLMKIFAAMRNKEMGWDRFLFQGRHLTKYDTPAGLGMDDGDIIVVI